MLKLLNKIKCKLFVCCKSQCSLNADIDEIDSIEIQKQKYIEDCKIK
jgi:hypothetical protein